MYKFYLTKVISNHAPYLRTYGIGSEVRILVLGPSVKFTTCLRGHIKTKFNCDLGKVNYQGFVDGFKLDCMEIPDELINKNG